MALTKVQDGGLNLTDAGLPAGSVLQVVQTSVNSMVSASAAGETTFNDISGMSVSITPGSTSNKILVSFTISIGNSTAQQNNAIKLLRDSTEIVGTGATKNVSSFHRLYSTPEIGALTLNI